MQTLSRMLSPSFVSLLLFLFLVIRVESLVLKQDPHFQQRLLSSSPLTATGRKYGQSKESLSFEETDAASKGVVSSLTKFVNSIIAPLSKTNDGGRINETDLSSVAPRSPRELLERIRSDYTARNYLWTGNIDLACFDENCRFQDPTLSFVGRNQFVQNVQNLQPIVTNLVSQEQSILLDVQLNEKEGFVQTRWNMVGDFTGLFWKPRLDVIGRTKFWYRLNSSTCTSTSSDNNGDGSVNPSYSVYYYDEEWEIPAYLALLQLFVPGG